MLSPQLMKRIYGFIFTQDDGTKSLYCFLPSRHCGGFSLLDMGRINHKFVGWSSPSYERIKINFDATVLTDKVTIFYIIRNSWGDLILATGKAISSYPVSYTLRLSLLGWAFLLLSKFYILLTSFLRIILLMLSLLYLFFWTKLIIIIPYC